jgi:hypothetical protein
LREMWSGAACAPQSRRDPKGVEHSSHRFARLKQYWPRLRHQERYLLASFLSMLSVALPCCSSPSSPTQQPPYPPSPLIETVTWDFANLVRLAPGSDLWPITWAVDDALYTSWGDGGGFKGTNRDGRVSLGFGRIAGPPSGFTTANVWGGKDALNQATFRGKCAGLLSVDGILYAWINRQDGVRPTFKLAWSANFADSWQLSPWTLQSIEFAPSTILNYGKDYTGARDDFVYFYGGAWGPAQNVYLVRVHKHQIRHWARYEFFKGLDAAGDPLWTSDMTQRRPVFSDPNLVHEVNGALKASVIYNPGIGRFLLSVPHGGVGRLGFFDAPDPWGPWSTVVYYDDWGQFGSRPEGLLYTFPTKWISADGQTMYMIFSGPDMYDSFNLIKSTLTLRVR